MINLAEGLSKELRNKNRRAIIAYNSSDRRVQRAHCLATMHAVYALGYEEDAEKTYEHSDYHTAMTEYYRKQVY